METLDKVKDIVTEQLGVERDEVTIESSFIDEEEFNIEIPDEAAEKIKTVQDVVNYIDEQKKNA